MVNTRLTTACEYIAHTAMNLRIAIWIAVLAVAGCSSDPAKKAAEPADLVVNQSSDARKVMDAIPATSALEHFEAQDPQGQLISYVALTDTDTGALVFVNRKLYGTLTRHDAQAFYSCRGYSTNAFSHWAHDAPDWMATLLTNSTPATEVALRFSKKSATQNIKDAAGNPVLGKLKSLISVGTNPLGLINYFNSEKGNVESSTQFAKEKKALAAVTPGMGESSIVEVMKPENVAFVSGGMVMSYPSHLVEFFLDDGIVKVVQQPSFNFLTSTRANTFYVPYVDWRLCTPQRWKEALPGKG